jgi:hypothetical protein
MSKWLPSLPTFLCQDVNLCCYASQLSMHLICHMPQFYAASHRCKVGFSAVFHQSWDVGCCPLPSSTDSRYGTLQQQPNKWAPASQISSPCWHKALHIIPTAAPAHQPEGPADPGIHLYRACELSCSLNARAALTGDLVSMTHLYII